MKWWKCWVTGLWLTNHTQKVEWQWRTLVDYHPSHWWGDAELSLQIHTQLHSHSESSLLRLFSIPSQLCHSPTLSFVIISSCVVWLWRRTQTVLMGVDRWLHAAEASEVTVKPLLFYQEPQNTQMHIHSTPVLPTFPTVIGVFFLKKTKLDLHLYYILMPFLNFYWNHSFALTALGVPPPLTAPGCQIKWESAISWAENGTCHLYWEVKYTVAHSKNIPNQKPKAADLSPFLYCLHVYCLVDVLLNKSIVLFLSAHSRWRCQRMAEFRVKSTNRPVAWAFMVCSTEYRTSFFDRYIQTSKVKAQNVGSISWK